MYTLPCDLRLAALPDQLRTTCYQTTSIYPERSKRSPVGSASGHGGNKLPPLGPLDETRISDVGGLLEPVVIGVGGGGGVTEVTFAGRKAGGCVQAVWLPSLSEEQTNVFKWQGTAE